MTTTVQPASDSVEHPRHYNSLPAACEKCGYPIECIDVIEHMDLCIGNAVKYVWRAGHKDPSKEIEDLEKAVWYLQRRIKRLKKEKQHAG